MRVWVLGVRMGESLGADGQEDGDEGQEGERKRSVREHGEQWLWKMMQLAVVDSHKLRLSEACCLLDGSDEVKLVEMTTILIYLH